MTREQLTQRLRRYCKTRKLAFNVDKRKGNGSHYRVRVGDKVTTVQKDLNPGRIERILKQLEVDPAAY